MSPTRAAYADRILRVQIHIQQHLDDDLSLERLAGIAGYSPYHFHRIFRGQVGESTDDYVRRLRMEKAAQSLRYRERSVLEIALDSGYGSPEAFSRAFHRNFGILPSEYQAMEFPPTSLREQIMATVAYTKADVRIEQMPPLRIAYIRVVGRYCTETLGPAFGRIGKLAHEMNLFRPDTKCLGVYYDDPQVTPPDKQRADVGITVDESFRPTGDVQVQTIPGGPHAVLTHKGPYDTLSEAYRWIYAVWLPESGREPGEAASYEYYLNDAGTTPPEELLTNICVPLAP